MSDGPAAPASQPAGPTGTLDVPVVLVCPEFSPDQAREWIDGGDVPELATAKHVDLVDIDSGHWPMLTQPKELARLLAAATGEA